MHADFIVRPIDAEAVHGFGRVLHKMRIENRADCLVEGTRDAEHEQRQGIAQHLLPEHRGELPFEAVQFGPQHEQIQL